MFQAIVVVSERLASVERWVDVNELDLSDAFLSELRKLAEGRQGVQSVAADQQIVALPLLARVDVTFVPSVAQQSHLTHPVVRRGHPGIAALVVADEAAFLVGPSELEFPERTVRHLTHRMGVGGPQEGGHPESTTRRLGIGLGKQLRTGYGAANAWSRAGFRVAEASRYAPELSLIGYVCRSVATSRRWTGPLSVHPPVCEPHLAVCGTKLRTARRG